MTIPCLMVVDDEPDNFDVIETLLADESYQLHYAASGVETIADLETYNPDLILMDVMMPQMDGIEVCRQIKAMPRWQAVPIIMVTALSAKEDLAKCLAAGADDFISKPINAIELRARVKSMLRIKHQYEEVQTLLKLRDDMAKMVVHDLRNPLASIFLSLEILASHGQALPADLYAQRLDRIRTAAESLQVMVDHLLQISRLESRTLRLNYSEVMLSSLIQSVVASFTPIASQKQQTIVTHLPAGAERKVLLDYNLMHRALDNLLSNAIKFSPVQSKIWVKLDFPTENICQIQVIDSGPGVPEHLRHKIFEKYEVGTLMPHISQIGLGLAFCKMVVEAHKGTLCVSDSHPQGAVFEILLNL